MVVNAQESDGKYIEVTGSSEIEVVPDEIHFLIQIKEYWQEEYTGKSNKEEDFRTKVPLAIIEKDLRRSLLKIGQPDIQLLTYQKFLSSLAPIIPYFLCTDSIIRYSDFAQTPTQILFNHSQWHFCPKIFFFISFCFVCMEYGCQCSRK